MTLAAFFAAILLALSGCTTVDIDEFYCLPQPQEEFLQLQTLIDKEIAMGSEYSAPTVGSIRQSVRLADLDGDGLDEALAFLKNKDSQPEICIYRNIDNEYVLASKITGEGTGIGRFEYADIDGNGISEILVSFKMSGDILLLKAYSLNDWVSSVILTANCTDFQIGDPDKNDSPDALVLNFTPEGGTLEMYTVDINGEIAKSYAKLSASMLSIERFRVSSISSSMPAIFVEGRYENEGKSAYLTDIFACVDGELTNITLDKETGDSVAKRSYHAYCTDINGDGTLEVPFADKLIRQPKATADYYALDWYNFDFNGQRTLAASTYHCDNDGWYYVLPPEWRKNLTVRREAGLTGERTVVLSLAQEGSDEVTDLITIYTLTDENRAERAKLDGRFILLSSETIIYAASLHTSASEVVSEKEMQDIISRFHLIYSEWNTGAV